MLCSRHLFDIRWLVLSQSFWPKSWSWPHIFCSRFRVCKHSSTTSSLLNLPLQIMSINTAINFCYWRLSIRRIKNLSIKTKLTVIGPGIFSGIMNYCVWWMPGCLVNTQGFLNCLPWTSLDSVILRRETVWTRHSLP